MGALTSPQEIEELFYYFYCCRLLLSLNLVLDKLFVEALFSSRQVWSAVIKFIFYTIKEFDTINYYRIYMVLVVLQLMIYIYFILFIVFVFIIITFIFLM